MPELTAAEYRTFVALADKMLVKMEQEHDACQKCPPCPPEHLPTLLDAGQRTMRSLRMVRAYALRKAELAEAPDDAARELIYAELLQKLAFMGDAALTD